MKPLKLPFKIIRLLVIPIFCLTQFGGGGEAFDGKQAIIIDHNCTKLASIPSEWINKTKETLHIAYGYTSHGSQLITGMTGLVAWGKGGSKYAFNHGGTGGALDLRGYPGNFGNLGIANDLNSDITTRTNYTAWEAATRAYLATNPGVNVIMWAWCYGMDTSEANINTYLKLMSRLERDFPDIKFVYMTGRTLANGSWVRNDARYQQILNYCVANSKILYDFWDIESWDPDGIYYGGDKWTDSNCDYDSDGDRVRDRNWAIDWQNANPGEWYNCRSEHSQPLNANLKAYATWWLWARLAGWDGK
jgi:hypothetical protein